MQVACANCQLSFQAPDGATGLVCPICRSPLRPPDAAGAEAAAAGAGRQVLDWAGGTLDDLISLLSTPAWSARVEVLSSSDSPVGEVHVIAGGVSDAIFEGRTSHEALDRLRAVKGAHFRIEPRLPNPTDGDLTFPGPDQGKLEERPLAQLMRYCEDYVLTTAIEVWRGNESAKVEYRRGEIVGVTVGGIDAPERLAEVMQWASGNYRLIVPRMTLPETAPKTAAPPPAAVVAPRAAGAASKTIFGMPAVDARPVATSAKSAAEAGRASPAPAAAASATAAPASAAPPPAAPPPSGEHVRPAASAPAAAEARASTSTPGPAARDRAAAARTIFGVAAVPVPGASGQAARPTPDSGSTASAPPPEASPAVAAPAAAAQPAASAAPPASTEKPATPAPAAAKAPAADKPSGRAEKPATSSGRGGRSATPAPKEKRAPSTSPASRDDRGAQPTQQIATRPAETPIWTYVGVGFVFGLALLGVYWLVMVLAN